MPDPWPHAPPHRFEPRGLYFFTAGTLHRQPFFDTPEKLDLVLGTIFQQATEGGVRLQAWAVLRNHYHLVASFAEAREGLNAGGWVKALHAAIGRCLNARDATPGRRVMYQCRDTALTFEKSWLARLHYVHFNPVHHRLVTLARDYPWCSAQWFESNARPAFVQTVYGFKIDRLNVEDDF